jgi:hypothetical protein
VGWCIDGHLEKCEREDWWPGDLREGLALVSFLVWFQHGPSQYVCGKQ